MPEFQITKKWREKGKLLRSIIHGTLLPKLKFKFKFFKIHKNVCMEDANKQSSVGLLPLLIRVPSRGLKKIGRAVSMRKHVEEEEEDGGGSLELCKKRIIMGKKCRALSVSGALQYDKNGVLVPEYFPSPSTHSFV